MKIIDKCKILISKAIDFGKYCWSGVWRDASKSMKVRIIKTLNLCVHTFLDSNLQKQAASLVYSTLLAIVPAFALLFAIGRGFGLQNTLTDEIYRFFPAQSQAIKTAMGFVDSYLNQASQGLFVGVGIVMLLWTLISLLSSIEEAFNSLWGVKVGRNLYRKVTDYTAICLLVPILMACSAGINIFMATAVNTVFGHSMFSPIGNFLLDCAPFFLCCIAFTISFLIIPNTKVRLKYAAISGLICGIAFQLVQTLFINGQIYVAKYNAIYGSFAFLPLMLVWLQLSWLILLFGCTLTFSLQNIFHFTFSEDTANVAPHYMRKITVVIAAIIAGRFISGKKPYTAGDISVKFGLPIRLIIRIIESMYSAGLIYYVEGKAEERALTPAVELSNFTVGMLLARMEEVGDNDFIPYFGRNYEKVISVVDGISHAEIMQASKTLLSDIAIKQPPVFDAD